MDDRWLRRLFAAWAEQYVPDRFFFVEIQVPEPVIPFQLHFTPAQWDLRVRIEWSDVRKRTRTVLSWISHSR